MRKETWVIEIYCSLYTTILQVLALPSTQMHGSSCSCYLVPLPPGGRVGPPPFRLQRDAPFLPALAWGLGCGAAVLAAQIQAPCQHVTDVTASAPTCRPSMSVSYKKHRFRLDASKPNPRQMPAVR